MHLSGGMKTNAFLTGSGCRPRLSRLRRGQRHSDREDGDRLRPGDLPQGVQLLHDRAVEHNKSAGTTEAECETLTAEDFRKSLQNMQASENAGRAKFDQAKVDACLAAIRAATCSELTMIRSLSGLPACDATFATPLVALGGTCGQDYECINSVCQKAPMAWEGVCAVGAAASGSCVTDHCAQNLSCDRGTATSSTDNVCVVADQENGAACNSNFECKSRVCAAATGATAKTCIAPTARSVSTAAAARRPAARPVSRRC